MYNFILFILTEYWIGTFDMLKDGIFFFLIEDAPARTVGWRDPGFFHTSFLQNLWPNAVYVSMVKAIDLNHY